MDLSATSMHPDVAKHFLFSGTKIIRARRPQADSDQEAVALAVVVRTGFNTTKGALVRSMLFPKPSGFKFYRDSFRYISVMALVAAFGFIASFVNFVRLRVSTLTKLSSGILINTVGMASHPHSCARPHHDCRTTRLTGNIVHWDKFCAFSTEKEKHLLY